MRQSNTRTVVEQKPLGIIDSISAGLDLVRRRPWTLFIPILLDLMIWLAPRLSLTQLFRPFAELMVNILTALSGDPQASDQARRMFQEMTGSLNLFGVVTTALNAVMHLPSLFKVDKYPAPVVNMPSPINAAFPQAQALPEVVVALFVPLFLLGLLLAAVYLEWIAQGVRPLQTQPPGATLVRIAQLWLRLIVFALLLIGLALAAALSVTLLQASVANPELVAFFALLIMVGLFWISIYFFFVAAAMAVSGIHLRLAVQRSVLLFRAFFWSAIGLVALSVFLERGLAIVWDGLTVTTAGVVIAIAANAYIGTSLIAAAMVYYQDRMNLIERWRQAAKNTKR
ncbi:MAG: hypothetical protein HY741_30180 [Chloroflexi bacterium]|nr:hypothetical protein [Chloroflexota bacterium]